MRHWVSHWPVEAFEMSGEIQAMTSRLLPRCGASLLDTADPGDALIEFPTSLDEAPLELKPGDEPCGTARELDLPGRGAAQHDERAAQHDEN